jgi:hypothetical protein
MFVPPGEERGEIGMCFLNFFYISFFMCIRVLTTMYLLCKDVGPVHPRDFMRTGRNPQPEAVPAAANRPTTTGGPPAEEDERVLRRVEKNLTTITHTVPMAEIEDLPPSMQHHVVGVPRTLVQIFQHLENVIIHYSRANRPRA